MHDSLTGLPNRSALQEHLDRAVARSRSGSSTAVMFLDLDRFKVVNDTLGHGWGDALLVQIAERLRAVARPRDLVARFGGDEFVVVTSDLAQVADALPIARRLLDALGEPVTHEGRTSVVSTSIGIALTDGIASAEEMLRNADGAMYRAKREGRNRIEFHDDALRPESMNRLNLEHELREALAAGALSLHYRPVVDLAAASPVAYQALLRWQLPERGLVDPHELIHLDTPDLATALSDWIVAQALSDLAAAPDVRAVSINVPTSQLIEERGAHLSELLRAACAAHGIAPARVRIEFAHAAVLRSPEATVTLGRLKDAGMPLVLDHVGSGDGSLDQLTSGPFDVVRMDPCLLDSHGDPGTGRRRLAAMVELVHAYGMICVAEVGRPGQLARLGAADCDLVQGPVIGRPGPLGSLVPGPAARAPLSYWGGDPRLS